MVNKCNVSVLGVRGRLCISRPGPLREVGFVLNIEGWVGFIVSEREPKTCTRNCKLNQSSKI